MITFKEELEKVEKYLAEKKYGIADNLLTKIKREFETIESLKQIPAGTSKTEKQIKEDLENMKNKLINLNIFDNSDISFKLELFENYANREKQKKMLEERFNRIKKYLDIE